tara:strand:+ start:2105 stop:2938 length:834 start_codon:yes stop_codon:yes gene_type:complete
MKAQQITFNNFFDKIFVISLFDKTERWKKVSKQFSNRGIKVERFVAIDGRCKDQGKKGCLDKLKTFEMAYGVRIPYDKRIPLKELIPASSVTIATILMLRQMVKKKWKHMLICEDDIELTKSIKSKFEAGIKELGKKKWDVLYLGCGGTCGNIGISHENSKKKKLSNIAKSIGEVYVDDIRDLRIPCEGYCPPISDHLSWAFSPGGGWCYAYSLSGAKKMLKLIDNNAAEHIDQLLMKYTENGDLRSIAFDPPIVMHEKLEIESDGSRKGSDIPWKL